MPPADNKTFKTVCTWQIIIEFSWCCVKNFINHQRSKVMIFNAVQHCTVNDFTNIFATLHNVFDKDLWWNIVINLTDNDILNKKTELEFTSFLYELLINEYKIRQIVQCAPLPIGTGLKERLMPRWWVSNYNYLPIYLRRGHMAWRRIFTMSKDSKSCSSIVIEFDFLLNLYKYA